MTDPYGQPIPPHPHQPGYPPPPAYGPPPVYPQGPTGAVPLTIPGVGQFTRANMGLRLAARILDQLIILVSLYVFMLIFARLPFIGGPKLMIVGIAAAIGYEAAFLALKGATLGKNIVGIRVVTATSVLQPDSGIGAGAALTRWAVYVLPAILTAGLWGMICSLSPFFDDANRQGFHDKAAHTYVISTK